MGGWAQKAGFVIQSAAAFPIKSHSSLFSHSSIRIYVIICDFKNVSNPEMSSETFFIQYCFIVTYDYQVCRWRFRYFFYFLPSFPLLLKYPRLIRIFSKIAAFWANLLELANLLVSFSLTLQLHQVLHKLPVHRSINIRCCNDVL